MEFLPLILVVAGIVLLILGHAILGITLLVVGLVLFAAIFLFVRFVWRTASRGVKSVHEQMMHIH